MVKILYEIKCLSNFILAIPRVEGFPIWRHQKGGGYKIGAQGPDNKRLVQKNAVRNRFFRNKISRRFRISSQFFQNFNHTDTVMKQKWTYCKNFGNYCRSKEMNKNQRVNKKPHLDCYLCSRDMDRNNCVFDKIPPWVMTSDAWGEVNLFLTCPLPTVPDTCENFHTP